MEERGVVGEKFVNLLTKPENFRKIQELMAKFKKGESGNPSGKPTGTQNKLTRTVKECVLEAFNKLQEHPTSNIISWGEKNPKEFYQIAAKLIPTELSAKIEETVIKVVRE